MSERSELVRLVADRVEALIEPVRRTMGEGTPAERTALEVVRIVEEAEAELAGRWISLQEAAERSGYSYDSLQRYAKAAHDGATLAGPWAALVVRKEDGRPYEVQVGSVPVKPGQAA